MDPRVKRKWKIGCAVTGVILFIVLSLVLSTAYSMARRAYIVPNRFRPIERTAREALGQGTFEVSFLNEEGDTVPGWFQPGQKRAAIVFLHGLGGNRAQLSSIAREMHDEGWGVLLIDQRGHGQHSRNLTTLGPAEASDAVAAVEWLQARSDVDPDRIGLYGASMGATTVIYAAARIPDLACAVADSSYADFLQQAYHDLNMPEAPVKIPPSWQAPMIAIFNVISPLIIGKWAHYPDPVDVIGQIDCPLFLIHGECDTRIDASQFDLLSRAAREAGVDVTPWMITGEGHCTYHRSDEFLRRLSGFFRTHLD